MYVFIYICIYVYIDSSLVTDPNHRILLFANGPKWIPKWVPNWSKKDSKLSQMDPKWVPKGVTREPQDTKMNLARFFGDPRPFWEPFWGQWDPKGIPKSSLWGSIQHQRRQKWCSGGGSRVRNFRGNKLPQWVFLGRLQPRKSCSRVGAVHI